MYCDFDSNIHGAKGWMRMTPDVSADVCPKELFKIFENLTECSLKKSGQCKEDILLTFDVEYSKACGCYNFTSKLQVQCHIKSKYYQFF